MWDLALRRHAVVVRRWFEDPGTVEAVVRCTDGVGVAARLTDEAEV